MVFISVLTLAIATIFTVILFLSYILTYWHYRYISGNKLYYILYSLSGGHWPPKHLKLTRKITISLYKTVITMLINIMLNNNRNKNLAPQTALTLLLVITQMVELRANRLLKHKSLIYYTCANSILVIMVPFTLIGLIINLIQIVLNLKIVRCKHVDTVHYWYWKCFIVIWNMMYVFMFK